MFVNPDLILLHAPSVYDFRKLPILFGPISDLVPSTPIFEMYPVGFSSISEHLERNGIHVRIINLALRMLKDKNFDAETFIARLHPRAFGLDLHWLPHAHGSLEIAALCKKYHPHIPIIFGGYSASYFHEELIRYPQADFVVRGDSAEEPLRQLLVALKENKSPENIPNLTWKNEKKEVNVNPLTHVLSSLDEYSNNYPNLFRSAMKYFDLKSLIPIHDWWEYPITAIMTCRGCTHNCVFCGGSNFGLKRFYSREACAYRSPEKVADDILSVSRYTNAPIFVVGDLRQAGEGYARTLLSVFDRSGRRIRWFWGSLRRLRNPISRWLPKLFPISILRLLPNPTMRKSGGLRENFTPMEKWRNRSVLPWTMGVQVRCLFHDRPSPADPRFGNGDHRLL